MFDYYVTGLKIGHQVPRFDKHALNQGQPEDVSLNAWISAGKRVVLVFLKTFSKETPILDKHAIDGAITAYVSKFSPQTLKELGVTHGLVVSDEDLTLCESYGMLQADKTITPGVVVIESTGACAILYQNAAFKAPSKDALNALIHA